MTQQYSVIIDREVDAPMPTPPPHKRGLWAWITRANKKAWDKYAQDLEAWTASNRKMKVRTFVPRATVEPDPSGEGMLFTAHPWTEV